MKYRFVKKEHIDGSVYWQTEQRILFFFWESVSWTMSMDEDRARKVFRRLVAGSPVSTTTVVEGPHSNTPKP